ncbi:MAG: serine hydrolase domain-containing protein [Desulfomonilaceae bacterium]
MKKAKKNSHSRTVPNLIMTLFLGLLIPGLLLTFSADTASGQAKEEKTEHLSHGNAEAIADRIIQPAMREKQLPSLVLGVVKNGRVAVKKGYGVVSFQSNTSPDENTVYYIGSLSKAVTAVGVMMLVEQGKINLNAPAKNYLKALPKSWQRITVAQFMAHQSGIPQLNKKFPTFRAMLRSADAIPLSFAPGTKQEYNNFNFAVTGKIIEAVTGTKYLDYMKRNVFEPLHMDSTGFDINSRNAAVGYRPSPRGPHPIVHEMKGGPYAIPSGHLQSTLADLLKFYEALETGKLLKPAAYREMIRRINPRFSGTPGWFERNAGRDSVVSKNGSVPGFHSIMSFVPGKGDAVMMLWTSGKLKTNDLFRSTNELLHEICGVGVPHKAEPWGDTHE